MVANLTSKSPEEANQAWEELFLQYREPMLAFIRSRGWSPGDAEDLLQSFFVVVCEKDWFEEVDREKGKLRTFLLGRLKNHLRDARKHAGAIKRGGKIEFVGGSRTFDQTESHSDTKAELSFDREWAMKMYRRSWKELESYCARKNQLPVLEILHQLLRGKLERTISEAATDLKMSPGSLHVSLHRLRGRLSENLRQNIAETMLPDQDIEMEIRYLGEVLAGNPLE